jgi:hypothetical protein
MGFSRDLSQFSERFTSIATIRRAQSVARMTVTFLHYCCKIAMEYYNSNGIMPIGNSAHFLHSFGQNDSSGIIVASMISVTCTFLP